MGLRIAECPECGHRYKLSSLGKPPICYHGDIPSEVDFTRGCYMILLGTVKDESLRLKPEQSPRDWIYSLTEKDFEEVK